VNAVLASAGVAIALVASAAPLLPTLYANAPALPGSPSFFFLRLGVVIALVPLAYAWTSVWSGYSPIQDLGRASLFIYWIHVEMVYGVVSSAIHKQLTLPVALMAFALFTLCMYFLARLAQGASPTRFLKTARQQFSTR
jgi:fucose 4-O-acetylase-like acetyltransferase